jgi:hypothetical protein
MKTCSVCGSLIPANQVTNVFNYSLCPCCARQHTGALDNNGTLIKK